MVYSYLFSFCYLEQLDSLRLGHAKRLISWVGLYTLEIMCKRNMIFSGNIFLIVSIVTIYLRYSQTLYKRWRFQTRKNIVHVHDIIVQNKIDISVCLVILQLKIAIRNAIFKFQRDILTVPIRAAFSFYSLPSYW